MTSFEFFPEKVVWEITFACNMRCIHCGTSAGKKRPDELTTEEALNLIDELAELGTRSLTLSGGEPLMREDWPMLAARGKERGMKVYFISNGHAFTEETALELKRVGIDNVGISFDGTEKTHNYIRQREDSWQRAVNAMSLLAKHGLLFCAVTQVSNINLGELDDIRQTLIDLGCKLWRVQMTTFTGRMHKDLVLSLDNYPRLIDKLMEFKQKNDEIRIDVGENIGYYGCKGTRLWGINPYLGCYAGTRVAGIESNGNIKGCLSMPEEFVEGNIRDSSFSEIWNNDEGFLYNRRFTRQTASGPCKECRYLPLCRGGCATTSVSATGERANNPYCIYQIERKNGIEPEDTEMITKLLELIKE
ncbi:MAG: radical SAM protein [Candidatus Zixiibacteriota bacterium]|nr:MAG: radical SAM protein [candidate division Zixibacteria bacterium]